MLLILLNYFSKILQRETSTKFSGAGENVTHHHHHHQQQEKTVNTNTNSAYPEQSRNISERSDYAVAEALKTIQKLSTMVERQETLLEAYSKDNEKLWTQLKDAKVSTKKQKLYKINIIIMSSTTQNQSKTNSKLGSGS